MKLYLSIQQDLRKNILSFGFLSCIILSFLMCFSATIYADTQINKAYTVIEVFFHYDRKFLLSNVLFSNINVFLRSTDSYLNLFLPIIVAFPYMSVFCSERSSGLMRFAIQRSGRKNYYISKYVTALISGGAAVTVGFLLYGFCLLFMFPFESQYKMHTASGSILVILLRMIGIFIYGAVMVVPSFLVSSFVKNRYVTVTVPFLLVYMYEIAIKKLLLNTADNGKNAELYANLSLRFLQRFYEAKYKILLITCYTGLLVITPLIYGFIMNRRRDLGE